MGGSRREPGRPRRFVPHALKNRIPAFSTGGGLNVRYWPSLCENAKMLDRDRTSYSSMPL
jgi:hypothetical protein